MEKILSSDPRSGRLKVAIVPHPQNVFPPNAGSVAGVVWESARRLAESSDVTIFSRQQSPLEKSTRLAGVNIHRVGVRFDEKIVWPIVRRLRHHFGLEKFALFRFYFYFAFIVKTALLIRRQGCQIIHFHNYTHFGPILRWFNPASRIILHMHCHWLVEMKWQTVARRLRAVDAVISPSASITEQTRRRFPQHAANFLTVPNGVDTEFFSRRNGENVQALRHRHGLQNKNVVLFVGRLTPEKGVQVLLEAMARVQLVFPNAVLVLAGAKYLTPISPRARTDQLYQQFETMKQDYESFLNDLITRHHLNVIFTGFTPHEELVNWYSLATLVAVPSFEEAGPLSVLEAMSCGVPVVATAVDGVKDYLPGAAGFLAPPNDPAALAERILACLQDRARCEAMGRLGRQWVENKFTWDIMANSLLSTYQHLAAAPGFQEPVYEPEYAA